jgi:tetraacyldisaccharide 4'-kinase
MYREDIHINKWLMPLSYLYGIAVSIRNWLFDKKILRSHQYNVPIICVGNLAVGGTGKTPHTEYLIRLLHKDFNVAVLSRGYKRSTKGYLLATADSTAEEIGDEPFQMMAKFRDIRVAVDSNRSHGIDNLLALKDPPVDVILLDDAYQHRYVQANINILLTSCNRLFCSDALLPAGRLREPQEGKERANIVIVTKCPDDIKPIDFNVITKNLGLLPYQHLFFSNFVYGNLYKLFNKDNEVKPFPLSSIDEETEVLLLTGVAHPDGLVNRLRDYVEVVRPMRFADHHHFTADDLVQIHNRFIKMNEQKRMIITTEKDAARLRFLPNISDVVKDNLYVLPVRIDFLQEKKETFNQLIADYVRKNQRNSVFS